MAKRGKKKKSSLIWWLLGAGAVYYFFMREESGPSNLLAPGFQVVSGNTAYTDNPDQPPAQVVDSTGHWQRNTATDSPATAIAPATYGWTWVTA